MRLSPSVRKTFLASLTTLLNGQVLARIPSMYLGVFRTSQGDKVFGSVVISNTIDVMNVFILAKSAAIRLFPNGAMLWNVILRIGSGITRHVKQDIAIVANPTTFPQMVSWSAFADGVMAVGEVGSIVINETQLSTLVPFRNRSSATAGTDRVRRESFQSFTLLARC